MRRHLGSTLVLVVATSVACSPPTDDALSGDRAETVSTRQTEKSEQSEQSEQSGQAALSETRVLAISIDALNPNAIRQLGEERTPHLHRLLEEGVATLDARSAYESTSTLPNHTGMVTGRRVEAAQGGHGVTFNTDVPGSTVQKAAGHPVSSVFAVVHRAGGSSAVFAAERKFSIFKRSWPAAVDRSTIVQGKDPAVARAARRDLVAADRAFTFVHLGSVDKVGHAEGGMSPAYLAAVEAADTLVGKFVSLIDNRPALAADVVVILTADHGTNARKHRDETKPANYRVPFVVWSQGIAAGDVYALDPDDAYVDPGGTRPSYAGDQPVRNADLANLAADLLGVDPVPGSEFGRNGTVPIA